VSSSWITFCFIAFSGVSQQWEFKNNTKNVLQQNRVKKFLQKKRFSRFVFYHVFGRFSVRRVQKHHKNILEKVYVKKTFPKENDKYFNANFSSFFFSSPFSVFLGDGISKTLQKTSGQKFVSKSFTKNRPNKSKLMFYRI
jgi:hypothetical protein